MLKFLKKKSTTVASFIALFLTTISSPTVSNTLFCINNKYKSININDIPANLYPKGDIVESGEWLEKSGKQILLICYSNKGTKLEPGYASELFAHQYCFANGKFQQIWKMKDFDYVDADIKYMQNSLEICDIDKDSSNEVSFFYEIFNVERYKRKFMLYTKGNKLTIREYGSNGSEWTDGDMLPEVDSIIIDRAFNSVSHIFKEYAIKRWESIFGKFKNINH